MSFVKKWTPIICFFIIYTATNLIGTLLLLFGPELYWKMTYAFTGQTIPDIYTADLLVILGLIVGSLAFLCAGFWFGGRLIYKSKKNIRILPDARNNVFSKIAGLAFWILSIYAFVKIMTAVNPADIKNWLNYTTFIQYRRIVIEKLSFFDWVIVYSFIPLTLAISGIGNIQSSRYYLFIMKLGVLVVINLYIFQKRPLCNALLLILFAVLLHFLMDGKNKSIHVAVWLRGLLAVGMGLYLIYTVGIFVNTIGDAQEVFVSATEQVDLKSLKDSSKTNEEKDASATKRDDLSVEKNRGKLFRSYSLTAETISVSKPVFVSLMAMVGLLNRTSFATILYPVIFPRYLDYYPIDIGLDLLGIGQMPDDALAVYAIINPQNPQGSLSAPFFVTLYAQGGLLTAWIGSLIVGFCFGVLWCLMLRMKKFGVCTAALGGLMFLFAVLLAMAGGRDSLLSSYGVIWPTLTLCLIYALVKLLYYLMRTSKKVPRICMLVTSGVVNDSRVIREATLALQSGFEVLMIGRYVDSLGPADPAWSFACRQIPIARARGGVFSKCVERMRLGLAMTAVAVRYRPDIVHCNDFDTLPFGFLTACLCDSAIVYDSHELWSENELAGRNRFGKRLVKGIEGSLARRCDAVISVSNAAGEWLKRLYRLDNLCVVTNCPNIRTVKKLPKNEHFEVLCHGMFAPDRGCEELIACAALVEREGIVIRLRGYGEKTDYFKEMAAQTGQRNIVFSEKVPSEQVVSAASASHVGVAITRPVSKSFELTVSNKLFEYLAAGLPVILSDVPEHRYLNEHYHFGIIVSPLTPERIAEELIRLKRDTELYSQFAENAWKASQELCFEEEGKKLVAIYRSAVMKTAEERSIHETDLA